MQRRSWLCQSITGAAIPACSITVYAAGTLTKATIYGDQAGSSALGNPITAGSDGTYAYYAANGRYTEVLTASGFTFGAAQTQDFILNDPTSRMSWATGPFLNVKDFGAKGDGTTNDAAAVQAAFTALPATGGTVYFPPSTGSYQFGTTRINVAVPVTILCDTWSSALTWNVTGLSDPGGNDRGILNIRAPSGPLLDYVKILGCAFEFGGSQAAAYAEGRRGVNIYSANNVEIRGSRFNGGVGEMVGMGNFGTVGSVAWVTTSIFSNFAQDGLNPNMFDSFIIGNKFLTGVNAIEAGRDRLEVRGNYCDTMTSYFVNVSTGDSVAVQGNRSKNCASVNQGSVRASIYVIGNGSNPGANDTIIANNVIIETTRNANQTGISSGLGTSVTAPARLRIENNEIYGAQQGIYITGLATATIANNLVVGNLDAGSSAGIVLANTTDVKNVHVLGNRTSGVFTVAAIQDNTVSTQNNLVGQNWTDAGELAVLAVPPTFAAQQNDYDPSRYPTWRLSTTGAQTITGIAAGAAGRTVKIINAGASNITLANQNASSAAANRIITGQGIDLVLLPDQQAQLTYDDTSSRWRITGLPSGGGTPGNAIFFSSTGGAGTGPVIGGTSTILQLNGGSSGIQINNQANNTARFFFSDVGGLQVNSPTGGDKGAGTINIATSGGYYINGVQIATMTLTNASGTIANAAHMVQDTVTLTGGTAGVALAGAAAFAGATSYTCVCDNDSAVLACRVVQNGGNGFTVSSGAGTDVVRFICVGS